MPRCKLGLPFGVEFNLAAGQKAITAQDFLTFGVPHDELIIRVLARVKLIQVNGLACATSGCAESNFAQAANFAHHVGGLLVSEDVNFVVALVGGAQATFGCELGFQQLAVDGSDDLFHIFFYTYRCGLRIFAV